jgi:thiol-disulfide isomerase/thioredoxin
MNGKSPTKKQTDLGGALKALDSAFVLFYASWCPFSQKFLPIFKEYSRENMSKNCISIKIDDREDICKKYSISVYPTVLFFEKGSVSKRLDGIAGRGLSEKMLTDFVGKCEG